MPGLFSTPDEVEALQEQQQQQSAQQYAQLGGLGAGPYLGMRGGQQLGGLLSGPDPAQTRALLVQNALREAGQSGQEMGSPKYFQELSKRLTQVGSHADALAVQGYGAGLEKTSAEAAQQRAKATLDYAQAIKALQSPNMENMPEAEKYRLLRKVEMAKPSPDPEAIKFYDDMIKNRSQTERSQNQEWLTDLTEFRDKVARGIPLTPSETAKAKYIYTTFTAPKFDMASGAMINHPGIPELNPYTNFGIGAQGGVAPQAAAQAPQIAPPLGSPRPAGAPPVQISPSGHYFIPGQKTPGENEMKILSEGDALQGHLKDLKDNFSANYVGPLAGRLSNIQSKTTGVSTDKQADFMSGAALFKDRMIKFITGAQMSELETVRLINEIPDINDPPRTFISKRNLQDKNIAYVIEAYRRNMAQGGIRQVGGNDVRAGARTIYGAPATAPAASSAGAAMFPNQVGWSPDGRRVMKGADGKNFLQ